MLISGDVQTTDSRIHSTEGDLRLLSAEPVGETKMIIAFQLTLLAVQVQFPILACPNQSGCGRISTSERNVGLLLDVS